MHDQTTEFAELRQSIERLSRKVEFIMRELHLSYPDADLPAHIILANELLRQGKDQEAIKVVREHTAIGIVEARDVVEKMRVQLQLPLRPVVTVSSVAPITENGDVMAETTAERPVTVGAV